jgi:acetylornithine deacetylase/succinyl-diaminopimelate desuccinylase-like protein
LAEAKIRDIARRRRIAVQLLPIREEEPVPLDKRLVHLLKECCEKRKVSYEIMPSGAGHDAMQMAKITPAGMLFIPSRRGISHSPLEWSDPKDICLGTQLLLDAIVRVANEEI